MSDQTPTTKPSMEQIATAIAFIQAPVGASHELTGDFATAVWGWFPRLGSKCVRNSGDPPTGYLTEVEAKDAARRYRASCEAWLCTQGAWVAVEEVAND